MAVGQVMNHLADRPASRAVRRLELRVGHAGDQRAEIAGCLFQSRDQLSPRGGIQRFVVSRIASDRVPQFVDDRSCHFLSVIFPATNSWFLP